MDSKITADGDCSHEIKRHMLFGRKTDQPSQHIKKQRHYFADKGLCSQSYLDFSNSQVWMWELDHKEGWAPKDWCFWTVVLEKTLETPLDCREIQPVHPKGDQSWTFIGRTDAEAETPILWPADAKNWLIGKDRGREEKWATEEEMVDSITQRLEPSHLVLFISFSFLTLVLRAKSLSFPFVSKTVDRMPLWVFSCLFVSESSGELPWLLVFETGSGVPWSLTKGPFSGRGGQRKPGTTACPLAALSKSAVWGSVWSVTSSRCCFLIGAVVLGKLSLCRNSKTLSRLNAMALMRLKRLDFKRNRRLSPLWRPAGIKRLYTVISYLFGPFFESGTILWELHTPSFLFLPFFKKKGKKLLMLTFLIWTVLSLPSAAES